MTDSELHKKFEHLINCECLENASDTPDFILATYLLDCLKAFEKAVNERDRWYEYGKGSEEASNEVFPK